MVKSSKQDIRCGQGVRLERPGSKDALVDFADRVQGDGEVEAQDGTGTSVDAGLKLRAPPGSETRG